MNYTKPMLTPQKKEELRQRVSTSTERKIKEQYILLEAVIDYVNECIVYCTNCEEEFVLTNSCYPEEEFYKLGWRATKYGNVYCPTCASKKLKLKEK